MTAGSLTRRVTGAVPMVTDARAAIGGGTIIR